jgi:hypothetical protein
MYGCLRAINLSKAIAPIMKTVTNPANINMNEK